MIKPIYCLSAYNKGIHLYKVGPPKTNIDHLGISIYKIMVDKCERITYAYGVK